MSTIHICKFSSLDSLKRKDQKNPEAVLRALHAAKKFSVFEVTANAVIARTMTFVHDGGYIAVDNSLGFPWSKVELTEKGMKWAGLTLSSRTRLCGE